MVMVVAAAARGATAATTRMKARWRLHRFRITASPSARGSCGGGSSRRGATRACRSVGLRLELLREVLDGRAVGGLPAHRRRVVALQLHGDRRRERQGGHREIRALPLDDQLRLAGNAGLLELEEQPVRGEFLVLVLE